MAQGGAAPVREVVQTVSKLRRVLVPLVPALLAGCAHKGDVDETGGITAVRSACPQVAVAAGTGDVTLFDPADARTADAIDVVADITNVRGKCVDGGDPISSTVTFEVDARRRDAAAPRDLTLPFFLTMVQGGDQVVAKRIGHVQLHFDAGKLRTRGTGEATGYVSRAAATLPENVRRRLTEKRKAGEADAAVDPLTRPEVRSAVLRATFEALVGFQLTDEQLRYNATR